MAMGRYAIGKQAIGNFRAIILKILATISNAGVGSATVLNAAVGTATVSNAAVGTATVSNE